MIKSQKSIKIRKGTDLNKEINQRTEKNLKIENDLIIKIKRVIITESDILRNQIKNTMKKTRTNQNLNYCRNKYIIAKVNKNNNNPRMSFSNFRLQINRS